MSTADAGPILLLETTALISLMLLGEMHLNMATLNK